MTHSRTLRMGAIGGLVVASGSPEFARDISDEESTKIHNFPWHNNPAELGARQRVRKRDVSFGLRTPEGAQAWDTFMTLAATTKKLGVSFYAYVHDRLATANQIPRLDRLVAAHAATVNLGPSWDRS